MPDWGRNVVQDTDNTGHWKYIKWVVQGISITGTRSI